MGRMMFWKLASFIGDDGGQSRVAGRWPTVSLGVALVLVLAPAIDVAAAKAPIGQRGQAGSVDKEQEKQLRATRHLAVSSDGTALPEEDFSSLAGEESFEGSALEGSLVPQDSLAEYPSEVESAEEVWRLLSLPGSGDGFHNESLIGSDSRTLVSSTTSFPARAVALVTFDGGRCTGWLYGRNVVATAGHCLHTGGSGGTWRTNIRVYPGRNGSYSPYGSCSARTLYSVLGWTRDRNEQYDYGAIKLNCNIGYTTGWFGIFWQSSSLTGYASVMNGYPGDKPLTQWRSSDFIRVTQANQIFYANDTTPGMSGSPVFRYQSGPYCTGYCTMGLDAYGLHGSYPHGYFNHGTRITSSVFNNLIAWRNAL